MKVSGKTHILFVIMKKVSEIQNRLQEEGLYSLFYHNCYNSDYRDLLTTSNLAIYVVEKNGESYLSTGEIPLPTVFLSLALLFLFSAIFWTIVLRRNGTELVRSEFEILVRFVIKIEIYGQEKRVVNCTFVLRFHLPVRITRLDSVYKVIQNNLLFSEATILIEIKNNYRLILLNLVGVPNSLDYGGSHLLEVTLLVLPRHQLPQDRDLRLPHRKLVRFL